MRSESARGTTLASWLECVVGLITVLGTDASFLPEGNRLELVYHGRPRCATDGRVFTETLWRIWKDLMRMGIPLPADSFNRSDYCGLLALT